MAMNNDTRDQDSKGRNWDQLTTGTTSAATMGAGSTGDVAGSGSKQSLTEGGAQQKADQQAGRTDDLLAGGSSEEQGDAGFQGKTDGLDRQGSQAAADTQNRQGNK